MYENKKDIERQGGSVTFFNKAIANFEKWEQLFLVMGLIGMIISFTYFNNLALDIRMTKSLGFGMITTLATFMISAPFRPSFIEGMR